MYINEVVTKMERTGHGSSPWFLKYLQIPGHSGPEQERTAITILKCVKKGLLGQQAMPEMENWKGKIRGEQMLDTQYQRGNLYYGC